MKRKAMLIYTDGACSGNPGPGGWAAILLSPEGEVRELGGHSARTTNNRMELGAVISALRAISAVAVPAKVFTDSTYVISGITSWLHGWKRKGWRTVAGKEVLNRDLWEELDARVSARGPRGVSFHYVRGHAGSPGNERCDEIAVAFSKGRGETLYHGPLSGYGRDITRLPEDAPPPKAGSARPKRSGGSYVSLLDGRLERHSSWADCSARVHGKPGARFKKVFSAQDEAETLRRWGVSG